MHNETSASPRKVGGWVLTETSRMKGCFEPYLLVGRWMSFPRKQMRLQDRFRHLFLTWNSWQRPSLSSSKRKNICVGNGCMRIGMAVRQRDGGDLWTLWGPTEVRNFRTRRSGGYQALPSQLKWTMGMLREMETSSRGRRLKIHFPPESESLALAQWGREGLSLRQIQRKRNTCVGLDLRFHCH